ncbi:MAG: hypothetical protein KGS61_14330, partial [Verrucomicrobia bacterium]|nr:hypothetical protein [Verrucomicrobiota bacterium]
LLRASLFPVVELWRSGLKKRLQQPHLRRLSLEAIVRQDRRKCASACNPKLRRQPGKKRKKEEKLSCWKREENHPEEHGISNRHFPTAFILPLTSALPLS